MATDHDMRDEIPAAELDRLYALYDGRHMAGGPAGIGIQVRDRQIRRLIDEVRRVSRRGLAETSRQE
jgi:hypothetical protein